MSTHTTTDDRRTIGGIRFGPSTAGTGRRLALMALIAAPAAGLMIAAGIVDGAAHRTTTTSTVVAALTVAACLVVLTTAISCAVGFTRSSRRPVFVSRWATCCGCELVGLGGLMTIALVFGDPFGHVTRTFRFGASDLVDIGLLVAIILSLVAGGASLVDASDHRRTERAWADHL